MILAVVYDKDKKPDVMPWDDPRVKESGAVVDLRNETWSNCGSSMTQHKFGELSVCSQTLKKGTLVVFETCTDDVVEHFQAIVDAVSSSWDR